MNKKKSVNLGTCLMLIFLLLLPQPMSASLV